MRRWAVFAGGAAALLVAGGGYLAVFDRPSDEAGGAESRRAPMT